MADDVELTSVWSKDVGHMSSVELLADPRRDRLFLRTNVDDDFYSGQVELTKEEMQGLLYALMDPLRIDRVE